MPKKILYFFYRDELHRELHKNRPADIITAWSYPQGKVCKYAYSEIRKNAEKAYRTSEVKKMLNRGRRALDRAIHDGNVPMPQNAYSLDEKRRLTYYYWSEKDILRLHDYFSQVHIGRPRLDGRVTSGRGLPTKAELRAMMRNQKILYIQNDDGEFVPTWQAERF